MWCTQCQKELSNCTCLDLQDRLNGLRNSNVIFRKCLICNQHYSKCKCNHPIWGSTDNKKPIVIEAVQWTGKNFEEVLLFCPVLLDLGSTDTEWPLIIPTLEGDHTARIGDFIIKGIQGEFYPCKPDIFKATYE